MSTFHSHSGSLWADNVSQHAPPPCRIQWAADIRNTTLELRTGELKLAKINEQFKTLSLLDNIHHTKKEPTLRELLDEVKKLNEQDAIYGYSNNGNSDEEDVAVENNVKVEIKVAEVETKDGIFVDISLSSDESEKGEKEEDWSFIKHEEGVEDWALIEHGEALPEEDELPVA